jgi:outer membrane protein TolC
MIFAISARSAIAVAIAAILACRLAAQPATPPMARVTFAEAIALAQQKNPTVAAASAGILRAEGLVRQARAATLVQLSGNVTTTTLNTGIEFSGLTVTPQNALSASLSAGMPIVAAAAWARRAQAEDTRGIAELTVADIKRQISMATADAFLTIVNSHRLVDSNMLARDSSKAHFDLASELEQKGTGSRLNALRAEQQYSTDAGLVEVAALALYRAQEALGVLIVADGPVDAADTPEFGEPPPSAPADLGALRTDLKLFSAQQRAAERIVRDSKKDWYPTVDALFQPSTIYPAQLFLPQNTWRFLTQTNVPLFDSGQRAAAKTERQAAVDEARATLAGATTSAASQVRAAREAIASGERALALARAGADQARQVMQITNVSFRAGAATNIEVIDAERTSRNADIAMALVEDQLRRARLELLEALGRFP